MIGMEMIPLVIGNNCYRSGLPSLFFLTENIQFKPSSPFYEILIEKICQMVDGGLIALWTEFDFNQSNLNKTNDEIGPQC